MGKEIIERRSTTKWITPFELHAKKGTVIPPEEGWKDQTWYAVDIAFSIDNVIHAGVMYTGFFKSNSYTFVMNNSGDKHDIGELYYIKAIRELNVKG